MEPTRYDCKVGIEAGDMPQYWIESPWTGNIIRLPLDRTLDNDNLVIIRVKIRAAIIKAYNEYKLDRTQFQVGQAELTKDELKEWQNAAR